MASPSLITGVFADVELREILDARGTALARGVKDIAAARGAGLCAIEGTADSQQLCAWLGMKVAPDRWVQDRRWWWFAERKIFPAPGKSSGVAVPERYDAVRRQ